MGKIYYGSDTYRMGFGGGDKQMASMQDEAELSYSGKLQEMRGWATTSTATTLPMFQGEISNIQFSGDLVSRNKEKQLKKEEKMLGKVKSYIDEHKNIIFTLGLVILVDHFLFKGALRERIKTSIEGVLTKVENKFHKEA